jgi:peptidoglycan/LPS O-acetylase OafA/YrhL
MQNNGRVAPSPPVAGRIQVLDGWRGIAILLVLIDHFMPFPVLAAIPSLNCLGQHGVAIFFVLSGFLITSSLLEQKRKDRQIDLPRFYIRRAFRLMPAALCFLGFMAIIHAEFAPGELKSSLLFYRNYVPAAHVAANFWSLSIEEQFYFVWPFLLYLIPETWLLGISSFGAAAIAFHRASVWNHYVDANIMTTFRTELRADALFIGCALALLMRYETFRRWLKYLPPAILYASLLLCICWYHQLIPLRESIVIALLLGSSVLRSTPDLKRPSIRFLGNMSYSIYIWQEVATIYASRHLSRLPLALLMTAVLV